FVQVEDGIRVRNVTGVQTCALPILKKENRHFADVTKSDAKTYAKKSIKYLGPVLQHQILSSSNRYLYIQQKLEDIIAKATFILSEQARLTGFTVLGIELAFGFGD